MAIRAISLSGVPKSMINLSKLNKNSIFHFEIESIIQASFQFEKCKIIE